MIELSKTQDGFDVKLDDASIGNIILNGFLNRLASSFSDRIFKFNIIHEQILLSITKFLENINLEYIVDKEIQTIINDYRRDDFKFEQNRIEALRIKQTDPQNIEHITIPNFLPEHNLTKYQNRITAHGQLIENPSNFSIPGSGKTWSAYAHYFMLQNKPTPDNVEKLLVICPKSAFKTWESEYRYITGQEIEKFKRITGSREEREFIFQHDQDFDVFLISYHMIRNEEYLVKELIRKNRFLVILDEAHHIKDIKSRTWESVKNIAPYSFRRMILTGTPMPNSFDDIWTQFNFLYPEKNLLGSFDSFRRRVKNPNNLTRIYNELEPYWTRIGLNQLDLPELEHTDISVPMKKIQSRIYRTLVNDILARMNSTFREDRISLSDINSHISHLLMASTDPSLLRYDNQYSNQIFSPEGIPLDSLLDEYYNYEEPGKLDVLKTMITSAMNNNEKLIIWCSFVRTIQKVQKICESMGYNSDIIYGEVPQADEDDPENNREKIIEVFKNHPEHNILIANPASLSESVSLHKECHHAIYVDRTYNAAHWIQSKFRIWRYGLEHGIKTKIDVLYSENSIEQTSVIPILMAKERNLLIMLREDNINVGGLDLDYSNLSGTEAELTQDHADVIQKIRDYHNDNS